MESDWDLHAVVNGFAAMNKSNLVIEDLEHSGNSYEVDLSSMARKLQGEDQWHHGICSTNLNGTEELHLQDFCTQSFFLNPRQAQSVQPTISSYMVALQAYKKQTQHKEDGYFGTNTCSSAAAPTQTTPKPKKRKKHQKSICHVPAEAVSSDVWSWRKYGQKPIKGSPYPRSYYKCSSSKACLARKQVERNRSDTNMFIVTYTAEHNHPAPTHKNCLSGTTRNPNSLASVSKPCSSNSMATMSPGGSLDDEVLQKIKEIENMAIDEGEDLNMINMVGDEMEYLNMDSTDDFYGDLEEISSSTMEWFSPDQFLPSFPWMANNGMQWRLFPYQRFPTFEKGPSQLRNTSPLVKDLCKKHNLPYISLSFWDANVATIKTLRSAALQARDLSKTPNNLLWEAVNTFG